MLGYVCSQIQQCGHAQWKMFNVFKCLIIHNDTGHQDIFRHNDELCTERHWKINSYIDIRHIDVSCCGQYSSSQCDTPQTQSTSSSNQQLPRPCKCTEKGIHTGHSIGVTTTFPPFFSTYCTFQIGVFNDICLSHR